MANSDRRYKRPALACTLCRRRKIRCNREIPCGNCLRSRSGNCVYDIHPAPQSPRRHVDGEASNTPPTPRIGQRQSISSSVSKPSAPLQGLGESSTVCSSSASASDITSQPPSSSNDVRRLWRKIRELGEQVANTSPSSLPPPPSAPTPHTYNIETTTSSIGGTFHAHQEVRLSRQPQVITRSVTHKLRLFGQSHWINRVPLFQDIGEQVEPHLRLETSRVSSDLQRCKTLAKTIKDKRAPPWPSPLTSTLPSKEISDQLVDCYFRTIEKVYRILHIPSFRRDYEAIWTSDAKPTTEFLVQLKLVLSIGAVTYDDLFSLRPQAVRWVCEAESWLSEPDFKARLSIQTLQSNILLLIARETVDVRGGGEVWISMGTLLRTALYMGLHRDPSHLPAQSTFAVEMRRRLWNTILEISLQSSITSGGPPLVSASDFDTSPPENFDDDQLVARKTNPVPKPEDTFTQASIAIALRKTFHVRLAIAKFLNNLSSCGTYDETLRLDSEMRASIKTLHNVLQGYVSTSSAGSGHEPSPSQFELRAAEFIMHTYLASLHAPLFGPALQESTYAFSRKMAVDTSLKLWCAAYPTSSSSTGATATAYSRGSEQSHDNLALLSLCGSGLFRITAFQAVLIIAAELRAQLQENLSLSFGPTPIRSDLFAVLNDAKTWALQCIKAGETNIKGYLLICVLTAYVEASMRGVSSDDVPALLVKVAEDALGTCLPILEEMLTQIQKTGEEERGAGGEGEGQGLQLHQQQQQVTLDQQSQSQSQDVESDWDFMQTSGFWGNPGNLELMSWILDDDDGGPDQPRAPW